MTEMELRRQITDLAEYYAKSGSIFEWSPGLDRLIEKYNSHKPLARNYAYKKEGGWCMLFASVLYIETGMANLICTEVGPWEAMQADKKAGRFREAGTYVPKPADFIYYHYEKKDAAGKVIDSWYHVGVVTNADASVIFSTEGNVDDRVLMLAHDPADRTIEGFCAPDFASLIKPDKQLILPDLPDASGIYTLQGLVNGSGEKEVVWRK